jgi:hypothetical protein
LREIEEWVIRSLEVQLCPHWRFIDFKRNRFDMPWRPKRQIWLVATGAFALSFAILAGNLIVFRQISPSCEAVFGYCLNSRAGPLMRAALKSIASSTRSAILMNGMPPNPKSLRSNHSVPFDLSCALSVKVSDSAFETPRVVNVPGTSKISGPVYTILVE